MRMFDFKKIFSASKENPTKKLKPQFNIEFNAGDIVRVCSDENKVKEYQNCKECGGYSAQRMQNILGKTVKVKHISQYCIKVEWENFEFDLHPKLIEIINQKAAPVFPINEHVDGNQKPVPVITIDECINENAESLFEAVEKNNIMLVYEKVTPALLNVKDTQGRTPINVASICGHKDIVEILLEFSADLDIVDNNGNSPIQNSALLNHLDIIKCIIENDGNQLYTLYKDEKTLLHVAIIQNNYELAKYLVEKDININIEDEFGKTAFQYTTTSTNPLIIKLIMKSDILKYSSLQDSNSSMKLSKKSFNHQLYSNLNEKNYYQMYTDLSSLMDPVKDGSVYNTIAVPSPQQSLSSNKATVPSVNDTVIKPITCKICYDREITVVFLDCGHTSCAVCARRLFQCHICQRDIKETKTMYI